MILFRVKIDCIVLPFPQVCHGTVYVQVRGTNNLDVAKFEAELLVDHRCVEQHRQEKHAGRFLESCANECQRFRAFPHTISQLSWKGSTPRNGKEGRHIISTIMGGEGEALAWHPIGKKRKTRFYNMS